MVIKDNFTDKDLHRTFVKLGNNRRLLTNELLAILPEIFERKIWCKYARTIEEYAGKFGGLSEPVVKKRLRLEKYLKDKPNLREAIATEGIHKVALVASLATVENEAAWADKVKNMSKPAIQELSKEVRWKAGKGEINFGESANENSNCKTALCSASPQSIKINLEGELFFMFLKLKKKYAKNLPAGGQSLSNQEVMQKIFEENLGGNLRSEFKNVKRVVAKINEQNEKVENHEIKKSDRNKMVQPQSAKSVPGDSGVDAKAPCRAGPLGHSLLLECAIEASLPHGQPKKSKSRYTSVHLRRNCLQKTAGKCSYPGCNRPPQVFHHKDRFANSRCHESLTPLCKIHHEFTHNGLIQNEKCEVKDWQLQLQTGEPDMIDQLYRKYRKVAR